MLPRRRIIIACLFLVVATLATYGDLKNHQFVNYDDNTYVTNNPAVQAGLTLKGFSWAFATMHGSNWHPLTWLSHMLDVQLFGLNPTGHHLTNLVFHIANALLLFLWLLYLTRSLGCSFLVAALFALHPMHVQSVAWVAERKDVLSTFFWLLTMWAYVWYVERPELGRYLLILLCFCLGLMAKPMLVTLPFVLLLLDYWPLGRLSLKGTTAAAASPKPGPGVTLKRLIWEKLPLFVLSALSCVVTFYAQRQVEMALQSFPFANRLANAALVYVSYLSKMLWPAHLAVLYPLSRHGVLTWQALLASLDLVVLTFFVFRLARRHPYLLVGWLWYLGTLVPVIGLVQVGVQAMADRYTYLPFIGLFIMVAYGMADLGARWHVPKFLLPVGAGVVLSALMICTWVQVGYWRDSVSLFEHALKVTGGYSLTHNNLGAALMKQGKLDQAIPHFTEALRLDPKYPEADNNLGVALATQGKIDEAILMFQKAIQIKPDYSEAYANLGLVFAKQGNIDKAIINCQNALKFNPNDTRAQKMLTILEAKRPQN